MSEIAKSCAISDDSCGCWGGDGNGFLEQLGRDRIVFLDGTKIILIILVIGQLLHLY